MGNAILETASMICECLTFFEKLDQKITSENNIELPLIFPSALIFFPTMRRVTKSVIFFPIKQ